MMLQRSNTRSKSTSRDARRRAALPLGLVLPRLAASSAGAAAASTRAASTRGRITSTLPVTVRLLLGRGTWSRLFRTVLDDLGWEQVHGRRSAAVLLTESWTSFEEATCEAIHRGTIVNRIPGVFEASDKASLSAALEAAVRGVDDPELGAMCPLSIVFGFFEADGAAEAEVRAHSPEAWWIVKDSNGSKGNGIVLARGWDHVEAALEAAELRAPAAVVQRYIDRPLLIEGRKFDIRLYACIESLSPLSVSFAPDHGLLRLCATPYRAPTLRNKNKRTMHLSNFSVNGSSSGAAGIALKGNMQDLRRHIADAARCRLLDARLRSLVLTTVTAMRPAILERRCDWLAGAPEEDHSFHIIGIDVLLDENLLPHLLEVNANPSMNVAGARGGVSRKDMEVKSAVMGAALRAAVSRQQGRERPAGLALRVL